VDGTFTEEYVFFDGRRVARRDGGQCTTAFSDHLGTAGIITNNLGVIQEQSDNI
jgi:hypothetical protein